MGETASLAAGGREGGGERGREGQNMSPAHYLWAHWLESVSGHWEGECHILSSAIGCLADALEASSVMEVVEEGRGAV